MPVGSRGNFPDRQVARLPIHKRKIPAVGRYGAIDLPSGPGPDLAEYELSISRLNKSAGLEEQREFFLRLSDRVRLLRVIVDHFLKGLFRFGGAQFLVADTNLQLGLGRDFPFVRELHDNALKELDGPAQVSLRLFLQEGGLGA